MTKIKISATAFFSFIWLVSCGHAESTDLKTAKPVRSNSGIKNKKANKGMDKEELIKQLYLKKASLTRTFETLKSHQAKMKGGMFKAACEQSDSELYKTRILKKHNFEEKPELKTKHPAEFEKYQKILADIEYFTEAIESLNKSLEKSSGKYRELSIQIEKTDQEIKNHDPSGAKASLYAKVESKPEPIDDGFKEAYKKYFKLIDWTKYQQK